MNKQTQKLYQRRGTGFRVVEVSPSRDWSLLMDYRIVWEEMGDGVQERVLPAEEEANPENGGKGTKTPEN